MKIFARLSAVALVGLLAVSAFAQSPAPMTPKTPVKGYMKTLKSGKTVAVKGYTRKAKPMPKMAVKGYTKMTKTGKMVTVKGYTRHMPMKGMSAKMKGMKPTL